MVLSRTRLGLRLCYNILDLLAVKASFLL